MLNLKKLIGLSKEKAEKRIAGCGLTPRITAENGEFYIGTADYNENRVNLVIVDDKVKEVDLG